MTEIYSDEPGHAGQELQCCECCGKIERGAEVVTIRGREDEEEFTYHWHPACRTLYDAAVSYAQLECGLASYEVPTLGSLLEWTQETMREDDDCLTLPYWPIMVPVNRRGLERYARGEGEIDRLRLLMEEGGRIAEKLGEMKR